MPADADQFKDALVHYRTKWYDAWSTRTNTGSTWASISSEWQTEYDAVTAEALAPTTISAQTFEGGSTSAIANLPQNIRLRALQAFRAEVQPSYAAALTTEAPKATRSPGFTIRFSPQ